MDKNIITITSLCNMSKVQLIKSIRYSKQLSQENGWSSPAANYFYNYINSFSISLSYQLELFNSLENSLANYKKIKQANMNFVQK